MMHVTNVVRYILVFIVNLLLLLFLHSYFNMVVLVVLIVLPFCSVFAAFMAARYMTVEIGGCMGDTETDEPFPVNIILGNRSVFPVMNVDIDIHMENCLFGISGDHRLSVPSNVRAANVVSYEISESFVGVLTVSVKRIYVTDWLGFIRIKKTSDAVKEIEVFPGGEIEVEPDMTTLAGGMSEAEETRHKGNDFSEVVDIREYQPGDKLQNIHWKLSAGRDELMVKERESMSSDLIIICVELSDDEKHVLNDILKAAYGLGKYLLSAGVPFSMYYWSVNRDDMIETVIENNGDMHEWMEGVFYEIPYPEYRLGFDMMQKLLDSDRKIFTVTAADDIDGEQVFTYGDCVKGYISE